MSMKVICRFMMLRIHYNDVSEGLYSKNLSDPIPSVLDHEAKILINRCRLIISLH